MNCTQCGEPIPEGRVKYFAVFEADWGLRLEEGCPHHTPANLETALATVNSIACAQKWLGIWMAQRNCQH
jgi:hypothetical protein